MKSKSMVNSHLVLLPCLLFLVHQLSHAADTLAAGSVMKDWEFLVSPNNVFKFGFFNPVFSSNRYLGIQYMNYSDLKIVWVANRENPLLDSSGYLNITKDGKMVIHDEKGTSFTINSEEPAKSSNIIVTLLDSGNLVLKADRQVVWQSFDHPTDTMLPGMKIGLFGLKRTQARVVSLTSWIGAGVPAAGPFTLGVDPTNTKQLMIWRRGVPYWRSGNWNGENFTYFPVTDNGKNLKFSHISNEDESYFTYTLTNYSFSWTEMNSTGNIPTFLAQLENGWEIESGSNCDIESEYAPKGCIKQKPSKCRSGDEFLHTLGIMEEWNNSNNISLGLNDCREICKNDCFCTAYGSSSADGSGCKFSHGKRLDNPPVEWTESFYIRNSTAQNDTRVAQELERKSPALQVAPHIAPPISLPINKETPRNAQQWVIIVIPLVSLVLLTIACSLCYLIWRKCWLKAKGQSSQNQVGRDTEQFIHELGTSIAAIDKGITHTLMLKGQKDHELPLFGFSTIETATRNFSEANKLGQGGFGPVYKGTLVDGQEIAVKRLSERSGQGLEEFKNEVVLISKVQHRNLVRILGCCIKGEEKMLIYEYLPNKSLDTFLFDETKRLLLDWRKRVNVIEGIAQGILYLHKFSRLKIIHRDLKTSNILLDSNMTPKISDFGTAKIFGDNESRANTNRIVGTYGYMSPEYAMDGLFSAKSDVFSFGVMMLEILSSKRNMGFYQSNDSLNLVRYAWNSWREQRSLELMDPTLAETCSTNEFIRCVQVALLCVQETAADRPTMSDVVSMLGSDTGILPNPKESALSTLIPENDYDYVDNPGSFVSDDANSSIQTQ